MAAGIAAHRLGGSNQRGEQLGYPREAAHQGERGGALDIPAEDVLQQGGKKIALRGERPELHLGVGGYRRCVLGEVDGGAVAAEGVEERKSTSLKYSH